jgi:hypothetical protein
VFNAATTDWADGLYTLPSAGIYPDTIINKITMNVLNRFLKNSFPPEIISWSPFNLKNERINRDPVVINKREAMVPPEDSIKLSFLAKDPFNKHVSFFWTADGMQAAGTDSVFVFKNNNTSTVPTKYIVTGFAYNSNDTAKISWDIFNSPLVINSQPVTKVNPGRNYSYSIEAYNYYSDSLSYLLQGPAWLKNNGNEISGTAPQDTGRYEIKVQVSNTHGQFDEQSFTIHVTANITGIQPATPPQSFALEQNYPNPFNPGTVISYKLGVSGRVTLKIFDILGNEVSTLVDKWQSSGIHKVDFKASKTTSGRQLSSGIYFYRLNAGGFVQVKKMMLLK